MLHGAYSFLAGLFLFVVLRLTLLTMRVEFRGLERLRAHLAAALVAVTEEARAAVRGS